MKDENKLRSFVDSTEDDVQLQRKTRLCKHSEVDQSLCKWFLQKHSEKVSINGVILKAQALQFNKLLRRDEIFKVFGRWLWRWKVQHKIGQFNIEGVFACANATAKLIPETLCKVSADAG
jgi:hypothetical protein